MTTPQDIREKSFEKAVFGGYDMAEVDTFLETLSADLELLQRENAALKGKMKVLVNKIEEYRSSEDAIRMALISAQRLGGIIEQEARDKAAAMVSEAESTANQLTKEARLEVEMEKARLSEAKQSSARFVENMELLCNRQLSFLEKVGEMDFIQEARAARIVDVVPEPAEPAAPAEPAEPAEIHETIKSIEETVAKVADEPVSTVRPNFSAAAFDDLPTKSFQFVTDPDDDLDKTAQFSFEGFGK